MSTQSVILTFGLGCQGRCGEQTVAEISASTAIMTRQYSSPMEVN